MNALNAYVYYNLKYYNIAIDRFQKCLQQGDSSLFVNRGIGFSYYLASMDSVTMESLNMNSAVMDSLTRFFLQKAFLQDTTNTNVLNILGKVNYKLGYYSEAVECFQKIVKGVTPANDLLYHLYKDLAMALEKSGAFQDAVPAYSKASSYTNINTDKMELYYAMATLADNELKDYRSAVPLYMSYRLCLFNYQSSLKDDQAINEIESKLTALDEYIKQLTEKAKNPGF
jgi:tetratricopeptide (TPR) repeat protein